MSAHDRLAMALQSDDLGWSPFTTTDVEYVTALGCVGVKSRTAAAIFRLTRSLDASSYLSALAEVVKLVRRLDARQRWRLKGGAFQSLAKEALDYFLCPVCPACLGRKFALLPDTINQVLSDKPCPACQGTGHRPIDDHTGRLADIAQAIEEANAFVVGGVAKRVRHG